MKKLFTWILAGACTLCLTPTFGQSNFWTALKGNTAPAKQPMSVKPSEYQLFSLQTNALKDLLAKAGSTYETGVLVYLPGPGQVMMPFKVWHTSMMEQPLADKYPQIQTYTASATENPAISAKLDFTDYGFRAAIYSNNEVFFIDPYSDVDNGYYIAFNAADLPGINKNFTCDINQYPDLINTPGTPIEINGGHQTANKQNGAVRHNYRLALACTGEYAQIISSNPTKALILQKIVSTVNRINGIYERELSVTFTLVGNEDSLVFIDPNTDPYTCNYNMNCLLNENQTTVSSVIGDANYDIGHILCTAGGGLAALSAVCNSSIKAEGASTSSGPDDFSTSLHEMGHQFSARHTFNATTGGCFNNIDQSSSYEPGSGSTIMSYGGLCSPNNIVFTSDNYFNVASLIQIHDYITGFASGNGCGTSTSGLNSVSIPSSLIRTYNIPKSTPFELVAPEITPSQANASISYTWEQYDLGNFGGTEADDGDAADGPTMRSYPPTDSGNIRMFPIDKILDGSYTGVGERLSTAARTLHFKLTARSILQGWGSLALMDSVVTVKVSGQGPFRATAPSSDATFDPGDTVTVKWDVGQTTQAPVSCHVVNIYLSLDSGQSFPILLMGSTNNDGEAKVVLPNVYTTNGYIKVQGVSNIFYDVAKGKLSINGVNGIAETFIKNHTKVFPNPATNVIHLEYTAQSKALFTVNLYDMTGRLVWSGKMNAKLDIPVANLARGQYHVQLINSQTAASVSYPVSLQ